MSIDVQPFCCCKSVALVLLTVAIVLHKSVKKCQYFRFTTFLLTNTYSYFTAKAAYLKVILLINYYCLIFN